ncbi:hypothetical protein AB8O38_11320 [Saccharomonospora xinjiangensis]|uniref:hypothetical protein n=1 Tax=Saccharomonospora xinjiangensis TaxID=75294 RepID=UPI00350F0E23
MGEPMCVCGWQLVAVTVLLQLLILGYGEIEGRRRSAADLRAFRHRQVDGTPAEHSPTARHRTGEPVKSLRARHDAETLPYYPSSSRKTT